MLIPKQFFFLIFDPVFSLPEIFTPPKSEVSLLIVEILKICLKAVFDSLKEASWSQHKTPQLLTMYGFRKNQEIPSKNYNF